jgi:membrane-bound metal-dependent hydrolase YbcI (DUF457 family)
MPFPIVHGVVAASLFIGSQRKVSLVKDWKIIMMCVALSILPDADFVLEWIFEVPGAHRGFTHSIAFGIAAGLLASLIVGARTVSQRVVLVLAAISHALLDVLVTAQQGTGIELLWPLTDYRFKLGLFNYFDFHLNPRIDHWREILGQLVKVSLLEAIIMGPLFLSLIFLKLRSHNQNHLSD